MQVSTQNSLTWLQTTPAAVAAADRIGSSYGQISPGDDASGAEAGQAAISGLQSPAQMFSPASLDTLISNQTDTGTASGSTASSTPMGHHHRHHHAGVSQADAQAGGTDPSMGQTATSSSASADSTDASVQADLSDLLMNV